MSTKTPSKIVGLDKAINRPFANGATEQYRATQSVQIS